MQFNAEVQLNESEQLRKERDDNLRIADLLREAATLLSKQSVEQTSGE
ncbi:hypothetical protein [Staphylococcus simulans]|nr:hypothetical protein [Staphylococcus simulans]MDY5060951.1 hypothetical protein [Staphylococcus simulans]